jgi:chlorobactene glucosyltransferase
MSKHPFGLRTILNHRRRTAAMIMLVPPLAMRANRAYNSLPTLDVRDHSSMPLPSLSIIVPARNEEVNLQRLLPSLKALRYPGDVELIVVDDNSSDQTTSVAQSHGATLINLNGDLPDGWKGKPNACHHGAAAASGDWLLFTDADTWHDPDSAASAVCYALQNKLDGLSLFLKQETRGMLDASVLHTAFAGLFSGWQKGQPVLNGQYILLRRDVYENSGGFATVRGEMLEDLAMGHYLTKLSYRVPILHGEKAGSVAMYPDVTHLWRGMTRLSAGSMRWSGSGSILTAFFITGVASPLVVFAMSATGKVRWRWTFLSWIVVFLPFVRWGRQFGSIALASTAPFGAVLVQAAAVWGFGRRLLGRGIKWKDRRV